jgi:hypothetical protein
MSALRQDLRFDGAPSAVQRLGLVIWWFALAVTVLIAALAVWIGWLIPRADDHRLEWMMKSGGVQIVLDGLARNNIRFTWPLG